MSCSPCRHQSPGPRSGRSCGHAGAGTDGTGFQVVLGWGSGLTFGWGFCEAWAGLGQGEGRVQGTGGCKSEKRKVPVRRKAHALAQPQKREWSTNKMPCQSDTSMHPLHAAQCTSPGEVASAHAQVGPRIKTMGDQKVIKRRPCNIYIS